MALQTGYGSEEAGEATKGWQFAGVCVGVAACLPQPERISEAQRQRNPGFPRGSFYCLGKKSPKSMESEDSVKLR